jgi:hypothetical protein
MTSNSDNNIHISKQLNDIYKQLMDNIKIIDNKDENYNLILELCKSLGDHIDRTKEVEIIDINIKDKNKGIETDILLRTLDKCKI